MAILNCQISNTGFAGTKPNIISIETDNTVDEVTTVGFLNGLSRQGIPFSEADIAIVTTRVTPNSKSIQTNVYEVYKSGDDWSLTGSATTILNVANGGTGNSSFTPYAVVIGGTTSTAPLGQISGLGTSGQTILSQGPGLPPVWGGIAGTMTGITLLTVVDDGTSGTYTVPAGVTSLVVDVQADGGGGGGCDGQGAGTYGAAGGGGGGAFRRLYLTSLAASYAWFLGEGGTAGASAGGNGGDGDGASFGSFICAGGKGGFGFTAAADTTAFGGNGGNGGQPASPGASDLIYSDGMAGFAGQILNSAAKGGRGGSTSYNTIYYSNAINTSGTDAGINAQPDSGCGGGGASTAATASNTSGGTGGSAYIIIYEYS